MKDQEEIWKDVKDYEGLYQVSNLGRVKSLDKTVWQGKVFCEKKGRILTTQLDKSHGYITTKLAKKGVSKRMSVHRIVMLSFVENPHNLEQVNHIDGVKINNYLSNLEWVSRSENLKHAFNIGLKSHVGTQHPRSTIDENTVMEIRRLISLGIKRGAIIKKLNISISVFKGVKHGNNWKHVI